MGTLPEEDLVRHMSNADALVVMKTGRNLPRVRRALERAGFEVMEGEEVRAFRIACVALGMAGVTAVGLGLGLVPSLSVFVPGLAVMTFGFFAATNVIMLILLVKFLPETRGLTLEQIEQKFRF